MTASEHKCRDCKWLDLTQKTSIGYACTNPDIKHARLGYLKQKSAPACKRGFAAKEEAKAEAQGG